MNRVFKTVLHIVVVALGAGLLTAGALRVGAPLSPAIHGMIFGAGAVLFAISDGYFTRLLTELNNVLRSTGYSVWQAERLRDLIIPLKSRTWWIWWISQGLKACAAVCAVILQKQTLSAKTAATLLWSGYFALFVAAACTVWMVRIFLRVEKTRDDLALEEVTVKEKKRLGSELKSGKEHDFKDDRTIQSYSKAPEKLP